MSEEIIRLFQLKRKNCFLDCVLQVCQANLTWVNFQEHKSVNLSGVSTSSNTSNHLHVHSEVVFSGTRESYKLALKWSFPAFTCFLSWYIFTSPIPPSLFHMLQQREEFEAEEALGAARAGSGSQGFAAHQEAGPRPPWQWPLPS